MKQPAAKVPAPKRASARLPGEVRIIGGQWKRTRLPVADVKGLRPTPDRVRETLFNWLGQDLTGWRCVDVFAGTGALGFEAASRGASDVKMFEIDGTLVTQLGKLQTRLKADAVHITRGDGVGMLARMPPGAVDLVFLDPPFDTKFYEAGLTAAARVLTAEGRIYLEAPEQWTEERLSTFGLTSHRYLKAGAVHAHLLCRAA